MQKIYHITLATLFIYTLNHTSFASNTFTITAESKQEREARLDNMIGIINQKSIEMGIKREELFSKYSIYAWCQKHDSTFNEQEVENYLLETDAPNLTTIIEKAYQYGLNYEPKLTAINLQQYNQTTSTNYQLFIISQTPSATSQEIIDNFTYFFLPKQ